MTNKDGLNYLLKLAEKSTPYHSGYEWSKGYAEDLKAYFADVNINEKMVMFARRENKELFDQSVQITSPIQASLGNILKKPFAKVERSNWSKSITVEGDKDDGSRSRAFEKEILARFGPKGLFSFLFERLLYWNAYDPNCFTVVEFGAFDNMRNNARPYPFEVTAEMAVDFQYDQSDLIYLVCRQVQEKEGKTGKYKVQRLTLYQAQQTIVLQELTPDEVRLLLITPMKGDVFTDNVRDGELAMLDQAVYQAVIPLPHNFSKTPAVRTGFIDNPEDDGETKLSILHPALPFAKKLLKINREIDLVAALVAHPIPFRAKDTCGATGCHKGYLADDSPCEVCHGTGYKLRPTTVSEELEFEMPDSPSEMFDPNKLMGYIFFPVEAAAMLLTLWDKWFEKAVNAVFTSDINTKAEVAQTARYHAIQQEAQSDALWPYGRHLSDSSSALSEIIGAFTGYVGANARPIIPNNLRTENVFDIFDELTAARLAGAGQDACAILEGKIMEIQLQDDPESLKRWRVDDYFNPFRGLSEAQILTALNSNLVPEPKKIFWSNRQDIMTDLVTENEKFYNLPRKIQKELIIKKIAEIQLVDTTPALDLSKLNGQGDARSIIN